MRARASDQAVLSGSMHSDFTEYAGRDLAEFCVCLDELFYVCIVESSTFGCRDQVNCFHLPRRFRSVKFELLEALEQADQLRSEESADPTPFWQKWSQVLEAHRRKWGNDMPFKSPTVAAFSNLRQGYHWLK